LKRKQGGGDNHVDRAKGDGLLSIAKKNVRERKKTRQDAGKGRKREEKVNEQNKVNR